MYTIRTLLAHPVAAKAAYPHFYLSGISLAKARTQKKGAGAAPTVGLPSLSMVAVLTPKSTPTKE